MSACAAVLQGRVSNPPPRRHDRACGMFSLLAPAALPLSSSSALPPSPGCRFAHPGYTILNLQSLSSLPPLPWRHETSRPYPALARLRLGLLGIVRRCEA